MHSQKLFLTSTKQYTIKQPYKKPTYKSYKELLQLDRPRKKVEYQSSESDQDFLERLLNEENQRSQLKKKRKKTASGKRRPSQDKVKLEQITGKQESKNSSNPNQQIKLIGLINRTASAEKRKNSSELSLIQEEKHQQFPKNQIAGIRFIKKQSNSLPKESSLKGSIFIDNKSIDSPAILYTSTNHLFRASLSQRKNSSAYTLLMAQKDRYLQQYRPQQNLQAQLNENRIQYNIDKLLEQKFKFKPDIEPLNHNWRYNLTVPPKKIGQGREFVDRKTLFRSKEEEERFIQSLREISKKKR